MDKLVEAAKQYLLLSSEEKTLFLQYLIFSLSIAGRMGYPQSNVQERNVLNYLKGINEVLHIISQQILAQKHIETERYEEGELFNIANDAFAMYAIPTEKMPMLFLDIIYMAFRDLRDSIKGRKVKK